MFCQMNKIELSPDKTQLQCFSSSPDPIISDSNLLKINWKAIPFAETADHVGIVWSLEGNSPALFDQIAAHRKESAGVLFTGRA